MTATQRVAICISGRHKVDVADSGRNILQNLVEPLNASIILALTRREGDKCDSIESCGVQQQLAALWPRVHRVALEPQPTTAELVQAMERLPHWPRVLASLGNRSRGKSTVPGGGCVRNPTWTPASAGSPYSCQKIKDRGNGVFAPVLGNPQLHVLHQLHAQSRCLDVLAMHEREAGVVFARVVHTRIEYRWLHPHPPLAALEPADLVWVPLGEDYGGVSDRHAVVSRAHAEVYFRRWDWIMSKDPLEPMDPLEKTTPPWQH